MMYRDSKCHFLKLGTRKDSTSAISTVCTVELLTLGFPNVLIYNFLPDAVEITCPVFAKKSFKIN